MRNLNTFIGSTQDFLDEIIASKNNLKIDPTYKDRLRILSPNVKLLFNNYDIAHNTNNHVNLAPYGYINQEKKDLNKLYSSNNSKLLKLKNNVTTILDNRAMNTCQYCTLTPINSIDHIVPKGTFPEFSVNPKNLLPACSTCNSYKSEYWKKNNKSLFLNLYTDILPQNQYLFVDLIVSTDNIEATFELRNENGVNADFFELLESHYSILRLPTRFKKTSNNIITELSNLISVSSNYLSRQEIVEIIEDKIIEDKNTFGSNYYKSILEGALINNKDFLDSIFI